MTKQVRGMKNPMKKGVLKRVCLALVVLLIASTLLVGAGSAETWIDKAATGFAGGTGTETDPYQIATAEQLAYLAQQVNSGQSYIGKYFKLTKEISLQGHEWTPIGLKDANKPFMGTLDGQNHEITGLTITTLPTKDETGAKDDESYGALIGMISGNAVVKNVIVKSGSVNVGDAAGIVARMDGGKIENCVNYAIIYGSEKAGGIVCLMNVSAGEIKNCINNGAVSGAKPDSNAGVAGIVGLANRGNKISGCENHGKIDSGAYAGGILGYGQLTGSNGLTIESCKNTGDVIGSVKGSVAGRIGGFDAAKEAIIENCVVNTLPVVGRIDDYSVVINNGATDVSNIVTSNKHGSNHIIGEGVVYEEGKLTAGNFQYAPPTEKVAPGYKVIENNGYFTIVPPVAKIGDAPYDTLHEAFEAAENDNIITLLQNVGIGEYTGNNITITSEAITLDLNGKDLTATGGDAFILVGSGATLTIEDKGEEAGSITVTGAPVLSVDGGKLVLKGGTFESTASNTITLNSVTADPISEVSISDAVTLKSAANYQKIANAGSGNLAGTFTDLDGNVLIVQGLNNGKNVKWRETSLDISAPVADGKEYRQYDDITVNDGGIVFTDTATNTIYNGTHKAITFIEGSGGDVALNANKYVTLKNISVLADQNAGFGHYIKFVQGGKLLGSSVIIPNANFDANSAEVIWYEGTYENLENEIRDSVIINGYTTGSSRTIIIQNGGINVVIDNNLIVAGGSGPGKVSSIFRVTTTPVTAEFTNNHIYSGDYTREDLEKFYPGYDFPEVVTGVTMDSSAIHTAFAIDGGSIDENTKIDASNNVIFVEDEGADSRSGSVVYINKRTETNPENLKAAVNLKNNKILGSTYVIYVESEATDDTLKAFTINGNIINNKFTYSKSAVGSHAKIAPTFEDGFWYETTPLSLNEAVGYTAIVDGQQYVAGNWWTGWSETKKAEKGYLELTVLESVIGAADLRPLVTVGKPDIKPLEISGETSLTVGESKILTAEFGGVTDFTWSVKDKSIVTLSAETGISVAIAGVKAGTTDLTVTSGDVTKTITLTVYEVTTPDMNSVVTVSGGSGSPVVITPKTGSTLEVEPDQTKLVVSNDKTEIIVEYEDAAAATAKTGEAKTVSITDKSSGTTLIVGYVDPVTVTVSGDGAATIPENPATIVASYEEKTAVSSVDEIPVSYQMDISLDVAETTVGNAKLPTLTPTFTEGVEEKIQQQATGGSTFVPLAMVQATYDEVGGITVVNDQIAENGISLKFIVPASAGTQFVAFHVKDGVATPLDSSKIEVQTNTPTAGQTTVVIKNVKEFSGYAIAKAIYPAKESSSSSSGSSVWLQEPVEQPTETPTENPTDKPTDSVPTDIPVTTPPTEEPASPGFGILAALAGLGVVAVLRRK